ncbi:hypothetical protein HDU79_010657 [Rhizoclosmatium sp. JEL0117]|nr:hypothetical protein HDU79_010657 [Rhizoclosmatium sp. JEL0117]
MEAPAPPSYDSDQLLAILASQQDDDTHILPSYLPSDLVVIPSTPNLIAVCHPRSPTPSFVIELDTSHISNAERAHKSNNLMSLAVVDQVNTRLLQDQVPEFKVVDTDQMDGTLVAKIVPFSTQPGPSQKLEFKGATVDGKEVLFAYNKGGQANDPIISFVMPSTGRKYVWTCKLARDEMKYGKSIEFILQEEVTESGAAKKSFFKKLMGQASNRVTIATYETKIANSKEQGLLKGLLRGHNGNVPWSSRQECGLILASAIANTYLQKYLMQYDRTVVLNQQLFMSHHHGSSG